jgi:hypothetical protein
MWLNGVFGGWRGKKGDGPGLRMGMGDGNGKGM